MTTLAINIACFLCYVNFEQFGGFDALTTAKSTPNGQPKTKPKTGTLENTQPANVNKTKQIDNSVAASNEFTIKSLIPKRTKFKVRKLVQKCLMNKRERPMSIGPYVVPTQLDLVLFTQRTLLKMFRSYHEKTLLLLKDIKEDTICNITSMKTDPIQLIKVLAMDEASLEFALPAFLRLLGGCNVYCTKETPPDRRPRLRQLTDQELVVRHFLTKKNYVQLIKDTNKYV
ncbi:hypothetical protein HF086_012007 [Spodoptera exigua]|uniref:Uncharacterized protein n=1 Tax=Spodoptera exigua TaxID=7107 RepID=A0A922MIJ9_SPOEX|nr:hypothetical protein HF086_012007 [Spodoptera exigua]